MDSIGVVAFLYLFYCNLSSISLNKNLWSECYNEYFASTIHIHEKLDMMNPGTLCCLHTFLQC
jgi:hypothetical protein